MQLLRFTHKNHLTFCILGFRVYDYKIELFVRVCDFKTSKNPVKTNSTTSSNTYLCSKSCVFVSYCQQITSADILTSSYPTHKLDSGKIIASHSGVVIQKAFVNPLLIEEREFQLRMYVLVANYDRKNFIALNGQAIFCQKKFISWGCF